MPELPKDLLNIDRLSWIKWLATDADLRILTLEDRLALIQLLTS